MNYPVWELYFIGTNTLIAVIAIVHVFIAHFAVGGGIFLWLTDLKSVRERNTLLKEYVKRHVWFFLLLTMVLGGVTGVGIWFIIALSSPWATSVLIHSFVFGWAIEWVFFLVEIAALLIYYYKFDSLSDSNRLRVAFIYAASAWLSLFIINGIITFMLTPGKWLETRNFWDGFFNPTHVPSLIFRTSIACMFAGLFGLVTAVFFKNGDMKMYLLRYCSKWLFFPLPILALSGAWYFYSVPEGVKITTFVFNRQAGDTVKIFFVTSVLIYILGLLFIVRFPSYIQKVLVFVILLIGGTWIGAFEFIREYSRRPYVIYGLMYSPGILVEKESEISKKGFLKLVKWAKTKDITEENKIDSGQEIFNLQCLSCHTVGGINNNIIDKTKGLTYFGLISQLFGQSKVLSYMPKFMGSEKEMEALAAFIAKKLHKKDAVIPFFEYDVKKKNVEPYNFDSEGDEYVLLAWNTIGMKCVTDGDKWFSFLYPGNNFEGILIKRGEVPELISEDVELRYRVEKGHENPSNHVGFWDFALALVGKKLDKNKGLKGKGLEGVFEFNKEKELFVAEAIPVLPYRDDGVYNPYPVVEVEALKKSTGKVLQRTKFIAPSSTEMKCWYCHGGTWRWKGVSGLGDETARNILAVHDKNSGTRLLDYALQGKPILCQSCHEDPIVGSKGIKGHNSLSASMHGWHANYIPFKDERACALCHPDDPKGNTRCNRDIHGRVGMKCIDCHGGLDDHATSLLLGEKGSRTAKFLLKHLTPNTMMEKINPRRPWVNEPDCLICHRDYERPKKEASAFNQWTKEASALFRNRKDETGKLPCVSCHGPPHSVYPNFNDYGLSLDNLQPLQYQGSLLPLGSQSRCVVCHKVEMDGDAHHPNMVREFRNKGLLDSGH